MDCVSRSLLTAFSIWFLNLSSSCCRPTNRVSLSHFTPIQVIVPSSSSWVFCCCSCIYCAKHEIESWMNAPVHYLICLGDVFRVRLVVLEQARFLRIVLLNQHLLLTIMVQSLLLQSCLKLSLMWILLLMILLASSNWLCKLSLTFIASDNFSRKSAVWESCNYCSYFSLSLACSFIASILSTWHPQSGEEYQYCCWSTCIAWRIDRLVLSLARLIWSM